MVGLGNIRPQDVTRDQQQAWQPILADWFQNADDAAVHSAAEWLLKRWELQVPPIRSAPYPNVGQNWHVTRNGLSIITIPSGKFQRRHDHLSHGAESPQFLTAPLKTVALTHRIQVSDREVSVRRFQQMMDDRTYDENEKAMHWHGIDPISSPTPDHPAQYVNWNDAVRFCNWLSRTEGFVPAYERQGLDTSGWRNNSG